MTKSKYQIPLEIYRNHLHEIQNVNFSNREIDVAACVFQGRRTSKIAELLAISPRTIEVHIRNITEKLDRGGSREVIVDFIEKSDKSRIIRNYYNALLLNYEFEKKLKELSKKNSQQSLACSIRVHSSDIKTPLFIQLCKHLKMIGIKDSQEIDEKENDIILIWDQKSISISKSSDYYVSFFQLLLQIFDVDEIEKFKSDFFSLTKNVHVDLAKIPKYIYPLNNKVPPTYYKNSMLLPPSLNQRDDVTFHFYTNFSKQFIARSDLIIPNENVRLERIALLKDIEDYLKDQNDIYNIAIIGPGGSGKTTVARLYAKKKKLPVVFEINAETSENLRYSFESLAYSLVESDKDNDILLEILDVKDPHIKLKRIITFAKERLRTHSNWLLIFDNVEKFSDIQPYFPSDVDLWGKGTVILTTRDQHVAHNNQIKSSILISELNPEEKQELFAKIMKLDGKCNDENVKIFIDNLPPFPLDITVAATYLQATSISFHDYLVNLKEGNTRFNETQKNILRESTAYTKTRYNIVSTSINKLIAENEAFIDLFLIISLISSQGIPIELLRFYKENLVVESFIYNLKKYCLLTNPPDKYQDINLISIHRSTQEIMYSFMMTELSFGKENTRIQHIIETYIKYLKAQKKTKNTNIDLHINNTEKLISHKFMRCNFLLIKLYEELANLYFYNYNFKQSNFLLNKALLKGEKTYNQKDLFRLYFSIGNTNKYLNKFDLSKEYYIKSLELSENVSSEKRAAIYLNLGELERILGNYKDAILYFDKGIHIYQTQKNKYKRLGQALSGKALVYLKLGEFAKAQNLFNESNSKFEKSINEHEGFGLNHLYLGDINYELGKYNEALQSYNESQKSFLNSSQITFRNFYLSWILGHIGAAYVIMGLFKKGRENLNKALEIHNNFISDKNHNYKAWLYFLLSEAEMEEHDYDNAAHHIKRGQDHYRKVFGPNSVRNIDGKIYEARLNIDVGNYRKAHSILEELLTIYETILKENSLGKALCLMYLGKLFLREKKLDHAYQNFILSLEAYDKYKHINRYLIKDLLSELYYEKCKDAVNKNELLQAKRYHQESLQNLKEALLIVNKSFPKESSHTKRLREKIKFVESKGFEKETRNEMV